MRVLSRVPIPTVDQLVPALTERSSLPPSPPARIVPPELATERKGYCEDEGVEVYLLIQASPSFEVKMELTQFVV